MQTSIINPQTLSLTSCINHSHVDMIALHSINYTSLKDLMPDSPPSTASPPCCLGDSWREIPIKDPLLQHAAWAYLQPMVHQRPTDGARWWRRFHDKVRRLFSCFNDAVWVVFESWFAVKRGQRFMIKVDRL